jgi:hypothetical protein
MLREGVVLDTNDPQQMGRLKIWVPSVDGDEYSIQDLPWASYATPIGGQTRDFPAGPAGTVSSGLVSYGFWAPPKAGALCYVDFLYNDPNRRVYVGSYFRDHGNRSLPAGRNRPDIAAGPLTDTFEPVQPAAANLKVQFNNKLTASEAQTRGVYERAVAQDKTEKDGTEGYQTDVVDSAALDPQTYCITTPGRHSIIMQDNPATGRVRIKTAAGHQLIMDDANERIYVSTAQGRSWIELDQDGRVHVYAEGDIGVSTGGDMNITCVGDFKVSAANIHLQSTGSMYQAACDDFNISGKGVNIDSGAAMNLLAGGNIIQTGANIHLNGPTAESASCPESPTIVPTHEPWTRAASSMTRNKNWKA